MEHSVHWVSTSLLKITTPLFLANAPLKLSKPHLLVDPTHLYWFFVNTPLKVGFFSESPKY